MQYRKGKNGFLRNFPDISAVFNQIETTFQTINSMDVRAGTLRTYVHRNIHLRKREIVSQNRHFMAHESRIFARKGILGRKYRSFRGYWKSKSKEWPPITSQYVSWLPFLHVRPWNLWSEMMSLCGWRRLKSLEKAHGNPISHFWIASASGTLFNVNVSCEIVFRWHFANSDYYLTSTTRYLLVLQKIWGLVILSTYCLLASWVRV